MGQDAIFFTSDSLNSQWLRKRRRALRGRNSTRDTQPDGAPTVHQPLAGPTCQGCFFRCPRWTPEPCLENPGAWGKAPVFSPTDSAEDPKKTLRFFEPV